MFLVEHFGWYDFKSDQWTFNYWLNSYIRFIKITSGECLRTKLEHGLVSWVPIMNKLLTTMVRRNMVCGAHEVYDDVLERGIYGSYYILHVLTNVFMKGRWLEFGAYVYSIVFQEACNRHCDFGMSFVEGDEGIGVGTV